MKSKILNKSNCYAYYSGAVYCAVPEAFIGLSVCVHMDMVGIGGGHLNLSQCDQMLFSENCEGDCETIYYCAHKFMRILWFARSQ